VQCCTHPLLKHKLAGLREVSCATKQFRRILNEISSLLAFTALSDIDTEMRSRSSSHGDGLPLLPARPIVTLSRVAQDGDVARREGGYH